MTANNSEYVPPSFQLGGYWGMLGQGMPSATTTTPNNFSEGFPVFGRSAAPKAPAGWGKVSEKIPTPLTPPTHPTPPTPPTHPTHPTHTTPSKTRIQTIIRRSNGKEISTTSEVEETIKRLTVNTVVEEDEASSEVAVTTTLRFTEKPMKTEPQSPGTKTEPTTAPSSPTNIPSPVHPKVESEFLPRLSKVQIGVPAFLDGRFAGWYRGYYGGSYLMYYGHKENPLCEIVPETAIRGRNSSKLREGPTLTEIQGSLELNVWGDDYEITNIARAAVWNYGRRPTMWVQVNNRVWISRSQLESLRHGTGESPVGSHMACCLILGCAAAKRDWYHNIGQVDEGDYFYNKVREIFTKPK